MLFFGATWQASQRSLVPARKAVRERVLAAQSELASLVIGVAGHAILLDQLLVESHLNSLSGNWHAFGRAQSDIGDSVTGDASLRGRAAKGCVAGETVSERPPWAGTSAPGLTIGSG